MITVLLSGGVDSAVLLYEAIQRDDVTAVFVDYGQAAHLQESLAAGRIAQAAKVPRLKTSVRLNVRTMNVGAGEPGPRIVPNRNLVLLAIAANLVPVSDEIWLGATAEDHEYPDCSQQFAVNATVALGITVRVPFVTKTRKQIRERGDELGAPLHLCWSCYQPDESRGLAFPVRPCGRCNSCLQDVTK